MNISNYKKMILSNGEEFEKILENNEQIIYSLKNPFCKNIPILYILFIPSLGFYLYKSLQDIYDKNPSYQSNIDKIPNLKKYEFTIKMIDLNEDKQNIFHENSENGIRIGHINTTFYHYYDKNVKKDIYTKEPEHTEYLVKKNNMYAVLLYMKCGEYSIKNIGKNNYQYDITMNIYHQNDKIDYEIL